MRSDFDLKVLVPSENPEEGLLDTHHFFRRQLEAGGLGQSLAVLWHTASTAKGLQGIFRSSENVDCNRPCLPPRQAAASLLPGSTMKSAGRLYMHEIPSGFRLSAFGHQTQKLLGFAEFSGIGLRI